MTAFGYVYLTRNLVNDTVYVGQHAGKWNPQYFGSGIHLIRAVKFHGISNFTVELLEEFETKDSLNAGEIDWIAILRSVGAPMYNIAAGGHTGPSWWLEGENHPNFGKVWEAEVRAKMSASAKGRKASEATKSKLSAMRKGEGHWTKKNGLKKFSPEHLANMAQAMKKRIAQKGHPFKGKKHTPESLQKMRIGCLAKPPASEETRAKLSSSLKLLWEKRRQGLVPNRKSANFVNN